jgi:hypothetical protein
MKLRLEAMERLADDLARQHRKRDARFGDIAIEMGMLTEEDPERPPLHARSTCLKRHGFTSPSGGCWWNWD